MLSVNTVVRLIALLFFKFLLAVNGNSFSIISKKNKNKNFCCTVSKQKIIQLNKKKTFKKILIS